MEATPISPQMRMYYRRKEAGLCINCGKPLDIAGVKCSKCRDRANTGENLLVGIKKMEYALYAVKTIYLATKKNALNAQPRDTQKE